MEWVRVGLKVGLNSKLLDATVEARSNVVQEMV